MTTTGRNGRGFDVETVKVSSDAKEPVPKNGLFACNCLSGCVLAVSTTAAVTATTTTVEPAARATAIASSSCAAAITTSPTVSAAAYCAAATIARCSKPSTVSVTSAE